MKNKLIGFVCLKSILFAFNVNAQQTSFEPTADLPGGNDQWEMVWNDEFDYENAQLDENWSSQNGPSTHILCSRWRENALVSDGTLKLINKKEQRGGQEWTSGNIWTKKQFKYGYYECRYKYAAAAATNNSFWLMTNQGKPLVGKSFEIDINEGHYPNEVNTNIHNWTDTYTNSNGTTSHPSYPKGFTMGQEAGNSFPLEIPIYASKIRFRSNHNKHFHIREFRIYNDNKGNYPDVMSATADTDCTGLINYARSSSTTLTASGQYNSAATYAPGNAVDGSLSTSWVSQAEGEKFLVFDFGTKVTVGCIQFISGWQSGENWNDVIGQYSIEYYNGSDWVDMVSANVEEEVNFARDYHVLGLEWNEKELVFYCDGKEIRRTSNDFCYSESPIWLSLAIVSWAGAVTDAIDGTAMEVDYVRVFQKKQASSDLLPAYYVRPAADNQSWTIQAAQNPNQVISVNNLSELEQYKASRKFYFAQGAYESENALLEDGIEIYGGFSGYENVAMPEQRIRQDRDKNGMVEPWEFAYPTVFTGAASNEYTSSARSMIVHKNSLVDGVTFSKFNATRENGIICVGTPQGIYAADVTLSGTSGTICNSVFENMRNTGGIGIVMLSHGSVMANCLLQNNTITTANSGGAVFINSSGAVLKESIIRNNEATGSSSRGAGIYAMASKGNNTKEILVQNCLVANNKSMYSPGFRIDPIANTNGTPAESFGFQLANCTFINNQVTAQGTSYGIIETNALFGRVVNTIVYTKEHAVARAAASGILVFDHAVTNKELSGISSQSKDNLLLTTLESFCFEAPFVASSSTVLPTDPLYSSFIASSYRINDASASLLKHPGVAQMESFIAAATPNIIPTVDMEGKVRNNEAITIGAYQYGESLSDGLQNTESYDTSYRVYPNPTSDDLHLSLSSDAHVRVVTATGRMLYQALLSKENPVISVASLSAGIYFLQINEQDNIRTISFIKK